MTLLSNKFSKCKLVDHSSGGKILMCLNKMGRRQRHFVHEDEIAMCEYHSCILLSNRKGGEPDTVSCSGAILRFGDDLYYFNPLTPFGVNFDEMLPLSRSAVDYFAVQYQYYYQEDVRSKFSQPVERINCTNNMRTCVTFSNSSLCFGNVENVVIIHSTESLIHGILVAFAIGALCYLLLKSKVKNFPLSVVFGFYIVPLIGIGMAYTGWFLAMSIPYMMGNAIVMFVFILLYYPLRDLNEYIIKKKRNERSKSIY